MDSTTLKQLLRATGRNQKKLFQRAREVRGNVVWWRGVIEFSNHCQCDCRYCGMRHSNEEKDTLGRSVKTPYRLECDEILEASQQAYDQGARSIILQSGEDQGYVREHLPAIVKMLRRKYNDMKLVSCIGLQSADTYEVLKDAGLDMIILKYETTDERLYKVLKGDLCGQPERSRRGLLEHLKQKGTLQISSGCIAGLPPEELDYDVYDDIAEGIIWLRRLGVDAVSVSPFFPHDKSPLRHKAPCPRDLGLNVVAVMRLAFPHAPIPAVSAFGLLGPQSRAKSQALGIDAGANVLTVNYTPEKYRKDYCIYTTNRNIVLREMLEAVLAECEDAQNLRLQPETRVPTA